MRLRDKVAIVVGAGQSPGEGMGNGRATVMRFVQEGAKVLAVDKELARAEETVAMVRGGECVAFAPVPVTRSGAREARDPNPLADPTDLDRIRRNSHRSESAPAWGAR